MAVSALNLRVLRLILLTSPLLFLTACGDGWEMVEYSGTPYSNIRTAGMGIAYVRENMLPGHGPIIEAAHPENKEAVEEPKEESHEAGGEATEMEKSFNKSMQK